MKKMNNKKNIGQTILELSILGSVFLLLFGLLIRYSTSMSQQQKTQMKAFRKALEMSATTTEDGTAARRNATVLWINDEKTVEGGQKYGSTTRSPAIAMGSGTFSNMLQMPIEYGEYENLSVFDIFVNGKMYTFRTSDFKCYGDPSGECSSHLGRIGPNAKYIYGDASIRRIGPNAKYIYGDASINGTAQFWNESFCTQIGGCRYDPFSYYPSSAPNPESDIRINYGEPTLIFWTKIPRTHRKFCFVGTDNFSNPNPLDPPGHHCSSVKTAEVAQRFDLRKDGVSVPFDKRFQMMWQWYPVAATAGGVNFYGQSGDSRFSVVDVDFDGKEEMILEFGTLGYADAHLSLIDLGQKLFSATYSSFDNNGARTTPAVSWGYSNAGPDANELKKAKIEWVKVIDYNEGDIDSTYNVHDRLIGLPRPGFEDREARIITLTPNATLKIDQEGVSGSQQTVTKKTKDSYTVIERVIQLSNNPRPSGWKLRWGDGDIKASTTIGGCGDPLDQESTNSNKYYDCFNWAEKKLYIRSRLADRFGYKSKTIVD